MLKYYTTCMYLAYISKLTTKHKHLETACIFSFQWRDSVVVQSYFYRRTENKNIYEKNFIELLNIGERNRQFLCKHAILQVGTTWSEPVHTLNDFSLVVRKKGSGNTASWKTKLSLEIEYIFLGHANQEFKLWWFRTHIWIFSLKSLQHIPFIVLVSLTTHLISSYYGE